MKMTEEIKKIYDNGENVMNYLKETVHGEENRVEEIMISYDFQAGSYYAAYKDNPEKYKEYHKCIAEVLNKYINGLDECIMMEAGIGDATSLSAVVKYIGLERLKKIYGFDISWSRVKYAQRVLNDIVGKNDIDLFVGDMFNIPVKDNSIDILYTIHSVEPNGGKEREILQALYRVTARYLILFEPAYELADEISKHRMEKYGYVTSLHKTAIELGYNVKEYRLLETSLNKQNPTGVMVIEKNIKKDVTDSKKILCDPITNKELNILENVAYCESSMLMYPVILQIPCLLKQNAILGTKFNEFYPV